MPARLARPTTILPHPDALNIGRSVSHHSHPADSPYSPSAQLVPHRLNIARLGSVLLDGHIPHGAGRLLGEVVHRSRSGRGDCLRRRGRVVLVGI